MDKSTPIAISEHELMQLTRALDEMHNDTKPQFEDRLHTLTAVIRDQVEEARGLVHINSTRRNFLRGGLVTAGALGAGAVVAACGDTTGGASPTASPSGDLKVAQLAASLEVLAVNTYQTALTAAGKGAFGAVPPAVATFATTAMKQHQDHENGWNSALTQNGLPAQTAPDPKYDAIVKSALPGLKTVTDVANLALTLETVAVETYTAGASLVTAKANRAVALTIAPVEAQHIAILNFVLGKYPVPASFIMTDMAASPSDLG
ncbi:MAG: ferritin-like domain-containing protein [Candidatus Dormibacteria bacterium]